MSNYTAPGNWCRPAGGISYLSVLPLSWEIGKKGSGLLVTVPAGVVFDASIPRGIRWLFDPHDRRYLKACALHDELLRRGWSRIDAGAVFHGALLADQVPAWRRVAMWLAVSLFKYA